jgi:hypothetical protein
LPPTAPAPVTPTMPKQGLPTPGGANPDKSMPDFNGWGPIKPPASDGVDPSQIPPRAYGMGPRPAVAAAPTPVPGADPALIRSQLENWFARRRNRTQPVAPLDRRN